MILARQTKSTSVLAALALCASVGAAATLSACGAVLGFDSLTLLPEEGGPSVEGGHQDGPSDDGATTTDGDGGGDAADATPCTGDLTTSKSHCGRCNHDCLGAACVDSQCEPIKLAEGLAQPEGLVVNAKDVFVAEYYEQRIARFGKNALGPCAAVPLNPAKCMFTNTNVSKPTGMGIDGTNVYWTNAGNSGPNEIRSCPQTGCGGNTPTLVAALGGGVFAHGRPGLLPLELVVTGGTVFWPENTGASDGSGGAIRSTPAAGGGAITTYLQDPSFAPVAIAVDTNQIFFTDDTSAHGAQIASVPRDASKVVKVIADTQARPYGIALSATGNVYWTVPSVASDGDGIVQATPKTSGGGAPLGSLATQQNDPRMVMVDAVNVYWLVAGDGNAATGLVVYCPLASGCPTAGPIVLASAQRVPKHITQDESAIYWSNEGLDNSPTFDGQVWKVAKP